MALAHRILVRQTLVEATKAGALAWSNETSTGYSRGLENALFALFKQRDVGLVGRVRNLLKSYIVKFGLEGSADVLGCIPPNGRIIALECKTENDDLKKQQRRFRDAVRKRGGIYQVIRDPSEVRPLLESEIKRAMEERCS